MRDFISNTDMVKIGATISKPSVKVNFKKIITEKVSWGRAKDRYPPALFLTMPVGRVVAKVPQVKVQILI